MGFCDKNAEPRRNRRYSEELWQSGQKSLDRNKEWFMKNNSIPINERLCLTVEEAAEYSLLEEQRTNYRLMLRISKGWDEAMNTNDVRICEKYALTVAEAAVYFGIGEKKLRRMIEDYHHLGLFLQNGAKYTIKRQKFEEFLDNAYAI